MGIIAGKPAGVRIERRPVVPAVAALAPELLASASRAILRI